MSKRERSTSPIDVEAYLDEPIVCPRCNKQHEECSFCTEPIPCIAEIVNPGQIVQRPFNCLVPRANLVLGIPQGQAHGFHSLCVLQWIESKRHAATCPNCRAPLTNWWHESLERESLERERAELWEFQVMDQFMRERLLREQNEQNDQFGPLPAPLLAQLAVPRNEPADEDMPHHLPHHLPAPVPVAVQLPVPFPILEYATRLISGSEIVRRVGNLQKGAVRVLNRHLLRFWEQYYGRSVNHIPAVLINGNFDRFDYSIESINEPIFEIRMGDGQYLSDQYSNALCDWSERTMRDVIMEKAVNLVDRFNVAFPTRRKGGRGGELTHYIPAAIVVFLQDNQVHSKILITLGYKALETGHYTSVTKVVQDTL